MFVSIADYKTGISVSLDKNPDSVIRVQLGGFGKDEALAIYLSRSEALDLYSQLEKAIHATA